MMLGLCPSWLCPALAMNGATPAAKIALSASRRNMFRYLIVIHSAFSDQGLPP